MKNYFVTSEQKEEFNEKGEYLGISDKLAVFYLPTIGRRRYYRQSLLNPQRGLKLLTFKTEKSAKKVCDSINEFSGGGWVVSETDH